MSKLFVPRVKPGDPFSARVINQIAEAAERAGAIHQDDGETVTNALGTFRAQTDSTASSLIPFMLLTNMTTRPQPYPDTPLPQNAARGYGAASAATPSNNNPQRWRHMNAKAVRLAYTPLNTYVVRMNTDATVNLQFYFGFGSYITMTFRNEAYPSVNQAPSAATMQTALDTLPWLTGLVEVTGYQSYYGQYNVQLPTKQWLIRFSDSMSHAVYDSINDTSTATAPVPTYTLGSTLLGTGPRSDRFVLWQTPTQMQAWQDDYWPTDQVVTVWSGLPSQTQLRAGAFVWAQKVAGRGYVVLHAECYSQVTGVDTTV